MTFREGCFVIRNWMQVLKWRSWDFLSPLILQKMKEDNISQLGDHDAPFCEQYMHGSCYISLVKFKPFDQFNTPKLPQILDIYSVVALWIIFSLTKELNGNLLLTMNNQQWMLQCSILHWWFNSQLRTITCDHNDCEVIVYFLCHVYFKLYGFCCII